MSLMSPSAHGVPAQACRHGLVAIPSWSRPCASAAIRQRIPTMLTAFALAAEPCVCPTTVSAEAGSRVALFSKQEAMCLGQRPIW